MNSLALASPALPGPGYREEDPGVLKCAKSPENGTHKISGGVSPSFGGVAFIKVYSHRWKR